jgi:excisionase family DNA binding protein
VHRIVFGIGKDPIDMWPPLVGHFLAIGFLLDLIVAIQHNWGMIAMLEEKWITISQAAEMVGCTPAHIRLLAKGKKIKAEKVGSVWLVERKQAETMANKPQGVGRPRSRKKL